jgi:hypothetical protein
VQGQLTSNLISVTHGSESHRDPRWHKCGMQAVSNTTPLRYLIAIEQEHWLGKLFEKVFVPVAVHEELTDAKPPEIVRRRVASLPTWLRFGQWTKRARSRSQSSCIRENGKPFC